MIKKMELKDLQVNDIFKYEWHGASFIGIVTERDSKEITFNDIVSLDSGTLGKATTISTADKDHGDFDYKGFICTYKTISPSAYLKELHPEYFL